MQKLKLELKEDQKLWFTGCTHFGHTNIAGPDISSWDGGYRNFDSVEAMDKVLIEGINNHVKKDDILIHLGDFSFKSHKLIPSYRNSLNVETIHLLLGNHDGKVPMYASSFTSIQDKMELEVIYFYKEQKRTIHIVCGHYPELSWLGSGKGYWMLHSHCHNAPAIRELNTKCKRFEASMDHAYFLVGEYRPFELRELVAIQDRKDVEMLDHHGFNTNVH